MSKTPLQYTGGKPVAMIYCETVRRDSKGKKIDDRVATVKTIIALPA